MAADIEDGVADPERAAQAPWLRGGLQEHDIVALDRCRRRHPGWAGTNDDRSHESRC